MGNILKQCRMLFNEFNLTPEIVKSNRQINFIKIEIQKRTVRLTQMKMETAFLTVILTIFGLKMVILTIE